MSKIQVLLISPYHGGSHRSWAEGLRRYSGLEMDALTLPARFWKWRMHGGAVTLARRFVERKLSPQVLLMTDMLDVTTFLALTRPFTTHLPVALYMHENQLTYPLPGDGRSNPTQQPKGERDLHYAFINLVSMLAADRVLFNSQYHLESVIAELPKFLRHFPDYNKLNAIARLRYKSEVLPVGIDFQRLAYRPQTLDDAASPLIVWNQRWEYDKNPGDFFRALFVLADEGVSFRLALCGEQFGERASIFDEAITRLGERIVHVGYAEPGRYRQLLWEAAVTVSTAHHEFFGISVLEAIYCHTFPILPHRLSYPELIPQPYHLRCLYQNSGGLLERLRWALAHRDEAQKIARELATAVSIYDWPRLAPRYDDVLLKLAG